MSKNKISLSAWVIVKCHLMLWRSPRWRSLVNEKDIPFYEACNEYCKNKSFVFRLISAFPDRMKLWLLERALALGAAQHFILRKKAIAVQLGEAVGKGVSQLVVIGGGFDLLALHTAQGSGIQCFEIDTPHMHALKKDIVEKIYGRLPANFITVPADLSVMTLHDVLSTHPMFRADRSTFFVAEGITMYLQEKHIRKLFADMNRLVKRGAFIAFTAIEVHHEKHQNWVEKLRDVFLSSSNEHFSWSLAKDRMPGFLAEQGFTQQRQVHYDDLQKPYRSEEEMQLLQRQHGEYLVYAQMPIG